MHSVCFTRSQEKNGQENEETSWEGMRKEKIISIYGISAFENWAGKRSPSKENDNYGTKRKMQGKKAQKDGSLKNKGIMAGWGNKSLKKTPSVVNEQKKRETLKGL